MADAWDVTTPVGSEGISSGDDRIREWKRMVQTALRGNAAEGTEAMCPGSDTANPVFRYRGLTGTTAARPTAGQYGLYFDSTRNVLQRDNGSTWADIGTMIPSGTVCVFYQASVPTGWAAVATLNDKFLRLVTNAGTGGATGGTYNASTSLSHSHTVQSHTHDLSNHVHEYSHSHTITRASTAAAGSAAVGCPANTDNSDINTNPPSVNSTGGAAPATDNAFVSGGFAYADVIFGTKS